MYSWDDSEYSEPIRITWHEDQHEPRHTHLYPGWRGLLPCFGCAYERALLRSRMRLHEQLVDGVMGDL